MISAAAQSTPRARLALARASTTSAARQTRQYRYGPWQVETEHDVRGRHRSVRYRYMETLSRRLSWDNKSARAAAKTTAQTTNHTTPAYAQPMSSTSATHADTANVRSWSDDLSSLTAGNTVRTLARDAVDQLLRPQRDTPQTFENLRLPFKSVRDYVQDFAPKDTTQTVDADKVIEATSQFPNYKDLKAYKSASFDDPNTPWELTAEEKSKHYDDLKKYRPIEWNEPEGLPAQSAEQYKDLDEYKPSKWNEPDGLPASSYEEQTKKHDDLHKYGPVTWNEPDGLPGTTSEEKTKHYKDLNQYGAATYSEPDGLRPLTSEEFSKKYDDLDKYSQGFKCQDSLLKAQQVREMDDTPRGTTRPAKVDVKPADYAQEYKDLDKYGPVCWNEPDGLQPPTPEELTKQYDDLDRYAQYDNAGPKSARIHPEEASKRYRDLSAYPRAGFEEHGVKEHVHPEELTKNYADLSSYKPRTFDSADRKYPTHPEGATKNYKDLNAYDKPVLDEISAQPFPLELNEHDHEIRLKTAAHQSSADQLETAPNVPNGTIKAAAKRRFVNLEDAKKRYQTSFEADAPKGPVSAAQPIVNVELEAARRAETLEDGKTEYAAEWGAEARAQPPVAEQLEAVAEQRLSQLEAAKAEHERRFEQERDEGVSSMDESFPTSPSAVHEATLNSWSAAQQRKSAASAAQRAQAQPDLYSKIPQGLEVSYSQETGEQDAPSQAVSGGRVGRTAVAGAEYVVLAFDPETRTVNVAETSSFTESPSSSPSSSWQQTPAEAIMRLSHPAKFFPHFQPLQAHGYEIVSGRGDVLIFRKVGLGVPGAPPYNPSVVGRRKRSLSRRLALGAAGAAGAAYGVGLLAEHLSTNGLR
ncbi:serine-threonine rich protein [Cordyceps javanica]|uniref:Serine-threonine rich protein n=1 Tax=Cordyceps javanica TaxID=43265 RepID=A0A545UTA2_9HYPO|nr:serine-threonine rich protein [Cordyceps javanica]TQW03338.1 serine-threonine rich protein [Cordyceps javanica]